MESFEKSPTPPGYEGKDYAGGGLKSRTAYARELFLYGSGDGKPVRDRAKLTRMAGISDTTYDRHITRWKMDAEELARGYAVTGDGGNRIMVRQVSPEHLALHTSTVQALGVELERLKNCLPYLAAGSDAHRETVKLLASLVKTFAAESGIAGKYSALETMEREMLKRSVAALANGPEEKPAAPSNGHTFDVD